MNSKNPSTPPTRADGTEEAIASGPRWMVHSAVSPAADRAAGRRGALIRPLRQADVDGRLGVTQHRGAVSAYFGSSENEISIAGNR